MRTIVTMLLMAAVVAAGTSAASDVSGFSDSLAKTSEGTLTPLQLADGQKAFRFGVRVIKHEQAEESLRDLIAQGLAKALWCSNGWEEVKRTSPMRGFWLVEGRCK